LVFSKTILVFVKELVRVTTEFLETPKKSGGGKVVKPRKSARRFYCYVTDIFITRYIATEVDASWIIHDGRIFLQSPFLMTASGRASRRLL